MFEVEELAVLKAAEEFDDWQDCTCEDNDGTCWYHLTDSEQMDWRVQSVASRLDMEEPAVRQVLSELGDYD